MLQDLIGEMNDLKEWQNKIDQDLSLLNSKNDDLKNLMNEFEKFKNILVIYLSIIINKKYY